MTGYVRLVRKAARVAWIAFLLLVAAAQEIHESRARRRRREREFRRWVDQYKPWSEVAAPWYRP